MRKHIVAAVAAASLTAAAAFAAEPGDIGYDPHADAFERLDTAFVDRWHGDVAH